LTVSAHLSFLCFCPRKHFIVLSTEIIYFSLSLFWAKYCTLCAIYLHCYIAQQPGVCWSVWHVRWFYRQIHVLYSTDPVSTPSVFEYNPESSKLCLKNTVSIHMYISTAPCGDASAFPIESVSVSCFKWVRQTDSCKLLIIYCTETGSMNLVVWALQIHAK